MTTEVIVPAPVTSAVIDYLNDELDDTLAHSLVPNPRPTRFVTVVRSGGFQTDRVIYTATLLFEAWGGDDDAASDLADLVYALVHAIGGVHGDVTFYKVTDLAGPGNLPDPVSEQSRFAFTLSVSTRSSAI